MKNSSGKKNPKQIKKDAIDKKYVQKCAIKQPKLKYGIRVKLLQQNYCRNSFSRKKLLRIQKKEVAWQTNSTCIKEIYSLNRIIDLMGVVRI